MEIVGDVVNMLSRVSSDKFSSPEKALQVLGLVADANGIGFNSLRKSIEKNVLRMLNGFDPDYWMEYKVMKFTRNIKSEQNLSEFVEILYRAYHANEEEQYNKIKKDMLVSGFSMTEVNKKLETRLKSSKKKGDIFESFETEFDYVNELTEIEKEEKPEYNLDTILNTAKNDEEKLAIYKSYNSILASTENKIHKDLKTYSMSDEFMKNKLIEKTRKYALEIALEGTTGSEYVIGKTNEEDPTIDKTTWVEYARDAKKNLGISTADYIYFSVKYENSTSTLNSSTMTKAVNKGIKVESYLKFKEVFSDAEKDLDAKRAEEKAKGGSGRYSADEKEIFYDKYLDEMDLPRAEAETILKFELTKNKKENS